MYSSQASNLNQLTLNKSHNQLNNDTVDDYREESSGVPRSYSLKEKSNPHLDRKNHRTLSRAVTENSLLRNDIFLDQSRLIKIPSRYREMQLIRRYQNKFMTTINQQTAPDQTTDLNANERPNSVDQIDLINHHSTLQIPSNNIKYLTPDSQIHNNSNFNDNYEEISNQIQLSPSDGAKFSSQRDVTSVHQQSITNPTNYFTGVSGHPKDEITDESTLKVLSILQNVKQHEHDYDKKRDELKDTLQELKLNYKTCGLAIGIGLSMATTVMASVGLPALAYCSEPIQSVETELSSQGLDSNSTSSNDSDTNSKKRQKNESYTASIEDDEDVVHDGLKSKSKRRTYTNTRLFEGLKVSCRNSDSQN